MVEPIMPDGTTAQPPADENTVMKRSNQGNPFPVSDES